MIMDLNKEKQIKEQIERQAESSVAKKIEDGRPVKLREILSDYFYKRRDRLDKEFVKSLRDTARRAPITADRYGEYKTGVFTYGAFTVEVRLDDGHWLVQIMSAEFGRPVPENVVETIRYKYVPDDVWMCKCYAPRESQQKIHGAVMLMEIPTEGESDEE